MQRPANFLLYDDQCPMCTFQMRALSWMDWFDVAERVPMSDPRVKDLAPTLRPEDLSAAIHCLARNGRIYRGARCIRYLGMRIPLLVPFALFLWIPGVIWVAEKGYTWVSRNRYILSKVFGCKEACAVLPERRRRDETRKTAHP